MKTYQTQPNDSFASIAKKFNIKDENFLKTFHNLNCPEDEIITKEILAETTILIPEDPQLLIAENEFEDENDCMNHDYEHDEETDVNTEAENRTETENSEKKNSEDTQKTESSTSEHDGKYFVIQKGMCQCNQGFKFPKFKVTSHQKHYWNDADGQADCLAVTEDDLTLDPPVQPFGQCKLKPTSGGYLPCTYAAAGKWTKTYGKVKVMGKSSVTEISELMCSTGGKITILKHGQQSEAGKSNVMNANSQEQHIYNPLVNFDEFKAEILDEDDLGNEAKVW